MKKLLFIYLLTIAQFGYSANLTEVNVFGEKVTDCNLSTASVTAALTGTMRYNRINVTDNFGGVVYLYHQVTAANISGGCAANVKIEFKVYEGVFVKNLNKKVTTNAVICSENSILIGQISTFQTRVNDAAKDMAQQCLLEISKK